MSCGLNPRRVGMPTFMPTNPGTVTAGARTMEGPAVLGKVGRVGKGIPFRVPTLFAYPPEVR